MRRPLAFAVVVSVAVGAATVPAIGLDGPKEGANGQTKHADGISTAFDVPVSEVAALREAGAGWGLIRHAYALSQDRGISVAEAVTLLESDGLEFDGPPPWVGGGHGDGMLPPGQAKQASLLESLTALSSEELVVLHAGGVGWGLIRNASALADAGGLSLDKAIEAIRSGQVNGQGPPPWSRNSR